MKQATLLLNNVFTPEETLQVINEYKDNLPKMDVLGSQNDNYRVAEGYWIKNINPTIERYKLIVAGITGKSVEFQEFPHFVKYDVGGEYKPHHDFFHPNTSYYNDATKTGGQRLFSSLLYLNDDFKGGETEFINHKIKIKPSTGSIINWRNITEDGNIDMDSLHAGLPVKKGTKYIVVIWTRENRTGINFTNTTIPKKSVLFAPKI